MIVRYYGHHSLKPFMRSKPTRFGYKLWTMCGNDGYCYKFSLYCGKETGDNQPIDSLGTSVVNNMLSVVTSPNSRQIFFDNCFTNVKLLVDLRKKGYRATGTLRNNRILNTPLLSPKTIEKRNRGSHDYAFHGENEELLVRWNDNKCVIMATNYNTVEPMVSVQRWNKNEKAQTPIPQPAVINRYNRFMGRVDQHDWLLEKHHIPIRGKKWYWCLITRIIDMAIVNACQLYIKVEQKPLSIKEFRRPIAVPYLQLGHGSRVAKERPISTPSASRTHVPGDVRFEGKNHLIKKREQQRRCQYSNCKGWPLTYCSRCLVTLCTACFPLYYTP
ncbi:hypothetical protein ILUMI_17486 [Ignelater luminosus]|uniref:PiggyBac transposable element-derived protein domain-containing protein n=1 Tax=Ignelater luminosus TaxID=2038154 RepID=A0A8K0G508_IGNLU|nr:hypothetical protein ILUMI_17486 [Ignelater luminosus]